MKPSEFLFEAEQNIKKTKANQYLDQLSDADLAAVVSLLQGSLEEGVQDLMMQKKAGKRIDGRPSDFIAYDDTTKTAKRYLETNNGLQVTDVRYSPPPRGYTAPVQSVPAAQPEVKSFVASLDNKEKEALLNVVKKEVKTRKTEPKKSQPKKSNSGKVVAGVLAGLLALGIYMAPSSDTNKTTTEPAAQEVKSEEKFAVERTRKAQYKIERHLKSTAFDEDSLKFRNWKVHVVPVNSNDPKSGLWVVLTGEVNGKNRFGAYTGYKGFAASIDIESPSGDIQSFYMDDNPKYLQALSLLKGKGVTSYPF